MDRRKSIKTIAVGTFSAGVLLETACKQPDNKATEAKTADANKTGTPPEGAGARGSADEETAPSAGSPPR